MKNENYQNIIDLDFSGITEFLEMCKSSKIDFLSIGNLIKTSPYQKMLAWTKNNFWGFDERDLEKLFCHSLISKEYNLGEKYDLYDQYYREGIRQMSDLIIATQKNSLKIEQKVEILKKEISPERIIEKVRRIYPFSIDERVKFTVFFLTSLGQGAAYKNSIFIETIQTLNSDINNLENWIAHELCHCLREFAEKEDIDYKKSSKSIQAVSQILFWLESEGVAELIGVNDFEKYIKMLKNSYPEHYYLEIYNKFSELLKGFNDIVLKIQSTGTEAEDDYNRLIESVSCQDAHRLGHQMAYLIFKTYGKEQLGKCVGKPRLFLNTYQEAAKRYNNPQEYYIFDEEFIELVNGMEWQRHLTTD